MQQLKDLSPILFVSSIAAAAAYGVGYLLHLNMYLDGVIKIIVFLIIYLGWSIIIKPDSYQYVQSIVSPYLDRLRAGKKA